MTVFFTSHLACLDWSSLPLRRLRGLRAPSVLEGFPDRQRPARREAHVLDLLGMRMKKDIHPDYHPVVFQDAGTGHQFLTRSTAKSNRTVQWEDGNEYPLIVVDVTSESHPFWTGAQRLMDTAGRVEKFQRRYGNRTRRAKKA
ncbi:50S ribosomal protein L31 type B [Corynebacterium freiburgense]|nr:50S ribosomal protein L31 type B [Corynebacterium freiburgense]